MAELKYPNESNAYRAARNELLEAEAELRAHIERVAALRRALPLGGEVPQDYAFEAEGGSVKLSELFAGAMDTLFLYGFMFGPNAEKPCPLCTSFLDSLDGNAPHLQQRINVAVSARAPFERLKALAAARGWNNLRIVSSANNSYQADYFAETQQHGQMPMANVFVRRDGKIHHSWGSELLYAASDDGCDSRHIDLLWPLWNVLDLTPDGRGSDGYPALSYEQ